MKYKVGQIYNYKDEFGTIGRFRIEEMYFSFFDMTDVYVCCWITYKPYNVNISNKKDKNYHYENIVIDNWLQLGTIKLFQNDLNLVCKKISK